MTLTIEQDLKEYLARLENKLDKFENKLDNLQKDISDLKAGQARLEATTEGLKSRIESQYFINRGILIALIVTVLGGLAKLFGFAGTPLEVKWLSADYELNK